MWSSVTNCAAELVSNYATLCWLSEGGPADKGGPEET
jgi:hypothetical protein